jgi:hypothetical protein
MTLEALIVVILILWLLGVFAGTGGSLIHLLLVIALVVIVIRIARGQRL